MAKSLLRLLGISLGMLALMLTVTASPALAGGGDPPTGPPIFNLMGPTVAIDGDRHAVLTYELTCNDQATAEAAHVQIFVGVGQQLGHATIGGGASTVATCAPGTQVVQLVVTGQGNGFHPGWVEVFTELQGCTSTECFQAAGIAEFKASPAR